MIKPFIKGMTQSELLTIMIGGMATIAGGVMAAYIQMLGSAYAASHGIPLIEAQQIFATQLLGASVMAAPGAMMIGKILIPETAESETKGSVKVSIEKNSSNVIEAAANGASDGLQLALNVGAMLLAFIALDCINKLFVKWIRRFNGIQCLSDCKFWSAIKFSTNDWIGFTICCIWNWCAVAG